jgi:hypothetical protein
MIPLRDSISSRMRPIVSYLMIGISSIAFFAELTSDDSGDSIIKRYVMIPARLSHPGAAVPSRRGCPIPAPSLCCVSESSFKRRAESKNELSKKLYRHQRFPLG